MSDPRPLTLADLWLPGDVLDGALLRGWAYSSSSDALSKYQEIMRGITSMRSTGRKVAPMVVWERLEPLGWLLRSPTRLDFTRPEVRDRAVRILGPDALAIHAAEIRGDITPGEAAGVLWCSVLRREAGLGVVRGPMSCWQTESDGRQRRRDIFDEYGHGVVLLDDGWALWTDRAAGPLGVPPARLASGPEASDAGRTAADTAALTAGYALREPGGVLLLPLPGDVVGRLECSNV